MTSRQSTSVRPSPSALLALLLMLVIASGCAATPPGGPSPEATAGAGFPATVATKFGPVTIDAEPQRVVALGWGDAETALALGVQPVGASDWLDFGGAGVGPWAAGRYDTAPTLIATKEPSYEQIAALRPDLILDVKSSGDARRHELLSAIAPTVGVPEGGDAYLTSMDQQVDLIATALGRADQGRALLAQVQQKFDTAAAAHPEFAGRTISVAAYTADGWGAYIEGNERVRFVERLGFVQNPRIGELEARGFSAKISPERLPVLDADVLVVFPIYLPASAVTDQRLFQTIPAVADGRTLVFTEDDEAIRLAYSMNSVLSVSYAIDEVTPRLAEALAGRG